MHPDTINSSVHKASFRDPCGFMYSTNGTLYRQINRSYQKHYDHLMESGLYQTLLDKRLLIPHQEVDKKLALNANAYKVIEPQQITYISYPYEWCFGQLKDAALTTLKIQQLALAHGMTLKDASAYNIQFYQGKFLLIDTLSFEIYKEGEPWKAYRQFCQHFTAPLTLMQRTDVRLNQLLRTNIDGVPLDLASRLLPLRSMLNFGVLSHIHLHAKFQNTHSNSSTEEQKKSLSKNKPISITALKALISSLASFTRKQTNKALDTEWGGYYDDTNYDQLSMQHKELLVADYLSKLETKPQCIHDLGANTGRFSRIAAKTGIPVISQDIDIMAVEKNYQSVRNNNENNILPLLLDLTNPSPALGWACTERSSFISRLQERLRINHTTEAGTMVMALALIHHLVISNNVPMALIAQFFSEIADSLIIEFVPKSDSQVKRLLATREDIFADYTLEGFEAAFLVHFEITRKEAIKDSERTLFLLSRK